MTMPHLENCRHMEDGWCLSCVKELGEENLDLRMALLEFSKVTFKFHFTEAQDYCEKPKFITVQESDHQKLRNAVALEMAVRKKWLF